MQLLFRTLRVLLILSTISLNLYSATLSWDSAGGAGMLDDLDLSEADYSPSPVPANYSSGEYYTRDGFLGRFVYEGNANQTLVATNIGPMVAPSLGNYFHYTKTDDTSLYRRVFLVATVKGLIHATDTDRERFLPNNNHVLQSSGDTFSIDSGAGPEEYDTTSSEYVGGYNGYGEWGFGGTYKYVHPYRYIWIDLTVIRTENYYFGNKWWSQYGSFELNIAIDGDGVSSILYLTGYVPRWNRPNDIYPQPDSYFFKLDRLCSAVIPIRDLMQRNSFNNRFAVGRLAYNSMDTSAKVYFASNSAGTAADFAFTSSNGGVIDYELVYAPSVPHATPEIIRSTDTAFQSSSTTVANVSPTHGETAYLYTMQGDLSIYLDPNFTPNSVPPGDYTSTIHCFLYSL